MFVAPNLPQDVLLAGTIMGTPATFFSKDTRSWNSSSVGFSLFFFLILVLITAQSFYCFDFFNSLLLNFNMQQTSIFTKKNREMKLYGLLKGFFNDLIHFKRYRCLSYSQDICASFGASLVAIESQTEEKFI